MVEERHRAIGQRIARLREAKGWTQEVLAHEADLTTRTVSRIETGQHEARGSTLRKLVEALDVPLEQVFGMWEIEPAANATTLEGLELKVDGLHEKLDAVLSALGADPDYPGPSLEFPPPGEEPELQLGADDSTDQDDDEEDTAPASA